MTKYHAFNTLANEPMSVHYTTGKHIEAPYAAISNPVWTKHAMMNRNFAEHISTPVNRLGDNWTLVYWGYPWGCNAGVYRIIKR